MQKCTNARACVCTFESTRARVSSLRNLLPNTRCLTTRRDTSTTRAMHIINGPPVGWKANCIWIARNVAGIFFLCCAVWLFASSAKSTWTATIAAANIADTFAVAVICNRITTTNVETTCLAQNGTDGKGSIVVIENAQRVTIDSLVEPGTRVYHDSIERNAGYMDRARMVEGGYSLHKVRNPDSYWLFVGNGEHGDTYYMNTTDYRAYVLVTTHDMMGCGYVSTHVLVSPAAAEVSNEESEEAIETGDASTLSTRQAHQLDMWMKAYAYGYMIYTRGIVLDDEETRASGTSILCNVRAEFVVHKHGDGYLVETEWDDGRLYALLLPSGAHNGLHAASFMQITYTYEDSHVKLTLTPPTIELDHNSITTHAEATYPERSRQPFVLTMDFARNGNCVYEPTARDGALHTNVE